jgi:GNAT superfamily N-acetyltransferase
MNVDDIPAGMRLCAAAGWNQLEADWRFFLESPASGAFLAENDGRVAGTAAYLRYDRLAWIAMMLVDPAERRSGIGGQLMHRVLDALQDHPCVGLDATPLGEPLYRRCGLVDSYTLVRTKSSIDAARFAPFAGRARSMTAGDFPAVFARDLEAFGADRSALLRSLFSRAPECAWIVRDDAANGYCFGRPGRLFHQLGPLVADTADTARDLTASCFAHLGGALVAIDAPRFDPQWLEWLVSTGFSVERPFLRMFRRGHVHPGQSERHYAITGPEFA